MIHFPTYRHYFNPRSREGSDEYRDPVINMHEISIHAPARGATRDAGSRSDRADHFNPRSREGSDQNSDFEEAVKFLFQSTLPRGERRRCYFRRAAWGNYFNPRSREGSDWQGICWVMLVNYFNPRSREGSDSSILILIFGGREFQSTLPRGERRQGSNTPAQPVDFNPRSREGSDNPRRRNTGIVGKFQSTLPRGERHLSDDKCAVAKDFNPRSREGSDTLIIIVSAVCIPFQSTLPRGERRERSGCGWYCRQISIHAPARGATRVRRMISTVYHIFQSTLPRGERRPLSSFSKVS